MALRGTNTQRLRPFHTKITNRQAPTPRNIQKHQLIVGLAGHAADVFGLGWTEGDYFEGGLLLGLGQFEMLYLGVTGF
jgi:hypothetical protein